MGSSNSVSAIIQLDRTNPFFFDSESISGTINVHIKDTRITAHQIFISLNGETGYITTHTDTDSHGSSSTHTDHNTISFLDVRQILAIPQSGQKDLIYEPGDYSWRFEIPLPNHLPPSLNQPQAYPHVQYYLKFVVDKAWYKQNNSIILHLNVFPRVNLMHNSQWLTSAVFANQNRKGVALKGHIDKVGYLPGETIAGTLEIHNPRHILIKKIQVTLIQYHKIEHFARDETIFVTFLPAINQKNDQQIIEKLAIPIPDIPLAPNYDFHGGVKHTTSVSVHYCLEFNVEVEGMFTNFKVSIPVIIGTESNAN